MSPDFDELVGAGLEGEERERLLRAHEALLAAGPPPELPASLRHAPGTKEHEAEVRVLPRGFYPPRRIAAAALVAASLAAAAFGGGFLLGDRGRAEPFAVDFVVPMTASAPGSTAAASLAVGVLDDDGNWPMRMTVRGLPPEGLYELLLTRGGKPVESCGVFRIADAETVVYLNAPYRLKRYDGWIVTRAGSDRPLLRTRTI